MKKHRISYSLTVLALASAGAITMASATTPTIGRVVNPNHPANENIRNNINAHDQAISALHGGDTALGFGGNESSFFVDYNFIDIEDERAGFPSGETNSFTVGTDVLLPSEVLIGLIYSYSETDLGGPFNADSDTNIITAYVAKSIQPWLTVGLTVGVGDTDTETRTAGGALLTNVENGMWSVSPFVSAVYASGPLFVTSTLAYQLSQVGGSGTHAFTWENNVGYQLSDSLTAIGTMRYFQLMEEEISNVDDENYSVLGAKLNYSFSGGASLYAGFEFDIWNHSYDTATFLTGYSRPF